MMKKPMSRSSDIRYSMLDLSNSPIALTEGGGHIIRYVNPAFCALMDKVRDELIGTAFVQILPEGTAFESFLDQVQRTGHTAGQTVQDPFEGQTGKEGQAGKWCYEIWPVLAVEEHPAGLMILVTETSRFNHKMAAMNEALLVAAVRQHELTDAAETLNNKLAAEMKERIQAGEALIRAEKLAAVGRMAASMAHEINNPLEAVINSIFLVRCLPELPETARKYLEIADEELRRVAHITRQTLGFYRESTVPTTTSVAVLLDSVVDLLQAKIKKMHVRVDKECEPGLQVSGVFGELRQVISNLMANSLDAVQENGTIRLRASTDAGGEMGQRSIRISVADSGRGIESAAMAQIFEPFFTTKGAYGTGLGLWVSKQLIDKHGGSIQVRSRTSGTHRGTTFSVVLPGLTTPQSRI